MRRDGGFILVNALLIVAALAVAAALLLGRAEQGRVRLELTRDVTQARLYLDGVEALALTLLDRDLRGGAIDHLGEAWAGARHNVAVDRGRVAGHIVDLQGRFNVNWLIGGEIPEAGDGIARLAEAIGLPQARVAAIRTYLSGRDDAALAAYASRPVPLHPRGAPLAMVEELRQVAGLTEAEFQKLRPLVTALPPGTPLNVNTAPVEVLASLLPDGVGPAARDLVAERRLRPFAAVEEVFAFLEREAGVDTDTLSDLLFTVESNWFLVESAAALGPVVQHRQTVMQRDGPLRRARVVSRLRRPE